MDGAKAQYDSIKAFSETDFIEDLKAPRPLARIFSHTSRDDQR